MASARSRSHTGTGALRDFGWWQLPHTGERAALHRGFGRWRPGGPGTQGCVAAVSAWTCVCAAPSLSPRYRHLYPLPKLSPQGIGTRSHRLGQKMHSEPALQGRCGKSKPLAAGTHLQGYPLLSVTVALCTLRVRDEAARMATGCAHEQSQLQQAGTDPGKQISRHVLTCAREGGRLRGVVPCRPQKWRVVVAGLSSRRQLRHALCWQPVCATHLLFACHLLTFHLCVAASEAGPGDCTEAEPPPPVLHRACAARLLQVPCASLPGVMWIHAPGRDQGFRVRAMLVPTAAVSLLQGSQVVAHNSDSGPMRRWYGVIRTAVAHPAAKPRLLHDSLRHSLLTGSCMRPVACGVACIVAQLQNGRMCCGMGIRDLAIKSSRHCVLLPHCLLRKLHTCV